MRARRPGPCVSLPASRFGRICGDCGGMESERAAPGEIAELVWAEDEDPSSPHLDHTGCREHRKGAVHVLPRGADQRGQCRLRQAQDAGFPHQWTRRGLLPARAACARAAHGSRGTPRRPGPRPSCGPARRGPRASAASPAGAGGGNRGGHLIDHDRRLRGHEVGDAGARRANRPGSPTVPPFSTTSKTISRHRRSAWTPSASPQRRRGGRSRGLRSKRRALPARSSRPSLAGREAPARRPAQPQRGRCRAGPPQRRGRSACPSLSCDAEHSPGAIPPVSYEAEA